MNRSFAQGQNPYDFARIEDNSFLIEEAYNQDPGVIQHISNFQYMSNKTWFYTFTDEWPAWGRKHQLSATIPVVGSDATGFGDIAINYRYQAIYASRVAFSPRFTFILPTGSYKKGLGEGVPGYQLSLPVSFIVSRMFVTHYNLGLTVVPDAKNPDGSKFEQVVVNYGFSIINFFRTNLNFMLEAIGSTVFTKADSMKTSISNSIILNPGFRFAINFKSGLQIVPGLAVPIGLDKLNGQVGVFVYLSFEHPLWKPTTKPPRG